MEINDPSVHGGNANLKMGDFFLISIFFHLSGSPSKSALKPANNCTDCLFFVSNNKVQCALFGSSFLLNHKSCCIDHRVTGVVTYRNQFYAELALPNTSVFKAK